LMFFQIFAEQIWMGLALVIPCDQGWVFVEQIWVWFRLFLVTKCR
jgi:hypothetical protein